jgi:hypothetical protein
VQRNSKTLILHEPEISGGIFEVFVVDICGVDPNEVHNSVD